MARLSVLGCVLAAVLLAAEPLRAEYPPAGAPEVFLWQNGAPGSEGATDKELYSPGRDAGSPTAFGNVRRIHNPSFYVFTPPKEKATGAAVVVIPGGGHSGVCVDHEGTEIARWLNSVGIAAFVLKYRLAKTPNYNYKVEGESLQDVQRNIRLVRHRASEWGVDPKRVGVMGFSAGGELSYLAATRYDEGKPDAADPIDRLSSRPDFAAIVYAGRQANPQFPADMPPVFMTVAFDDTGAANGTVELFAAMLKAKVPAELHVYLHGGHGFAMRDILVTGPNKGETGFPVSSWNARFRDWLADVKMVAKPESERAAK